MKNLTYVLLFFALATLIFSCDGKLRDSSSTLPQARGEISEIVLIMDSAKWAGKLGDEIKNIFKSPMPGLPQDEPRFSVRYVSPYKFTSILKNAKNLVFVTSLEDNSSGGRKLKSYFTKESLDRINKDPKLFMYTKKDEFARGQEVLHLFGKTDQELIENLVNNRAKILQHFNSIEKDRLTATIYNKGAEEKGIRELIEKKFSCSIKVPSGYEIAIEEEDFIWIRQFGQDVDKNFFISYKDYTSEEAFENKQVVNFRNAIAKKYLFGDPENPESYVVTEEFIAPIHSQVNFANKYAIESRGLWKTNNISMGGPFLSYTFVDEKLNRLYYIEGFVYCPGKNKRDFIKELEAILWTFKTSSEINQKKTS
jgi:hypothetical protein